MPVPRVAVIGCGASGMSVLSAFSNAEQKDNTILIPEIVCFEKQDRIGGLWNYTYLKGTDMYGEYVHGSMYRNLWSNGPKECLEMADYTFDEHFGKYIPSYPPREVLYEYLMGKAKKFDITKYNIRYSTLVRYVVEKGEQFSVISQNLKTQESTKEVFDYIVIATGHFSIPNIPEYQGFEKFKGQIIHGHDFRNADEYKGKTLLIIGNGYSGEDIALQSYKFGAKECIISYRSKPTGFKWPVGIREVPQLEKFENGLFYFKDDTSCTADVIICCTGYLNHYPFLPDNIRLQTENSLYPDRLYKGIVYETNNRVLYVGAQDQYFTFTLFDAQAYWSRDYILGKIEWKSEAERSEDMKTWRERFLEIKDEYGKIGFQAAYVRDLLDHTDYPEHGHEERVALWGKWKEDRSADILTYRDIPFPSTISKVTAPTLNVPWLRALDDSMDGFLSSIVS